MVSEWRIHTSRCHKQQTTNSLLRPKAYLLATPNTSRTQLGLYAEQRAAIRNPALSNKTIENAYRVRRVSKEKHVAHETRYRLALSIESEPMKKIAMAIAVVVTTMSAGPAFADYDYDHYHHHHRHWHDCHRVWHHHHWERFCR